MHSNNFKFLTGFLLSVTFIVAAFYLISPPAQDYTASPAINETVLPDKKIVSKIEYKKASTSYFWVGEDANETNGFISNSESAWDENWAEHYGGVDNPEKRCGFKPCGFEPKENPFYFALPYSDLDDKGERKLSVKNIPWYLQDKDDDEDSLLKNRWIEILYTDKTCYAQWEDVGPFDEDDFAYVFGANETPRNTFGLKAGLDVSPAVRDCLVLPGSGVTLWRFVEEHEVPNGPWKEIITLN